MDDKDLNVKCCELAVLERETKVRDAKAALDHGYARLKATFEEEYGKLKSALERETIQLEREKAYLENAKDAAAKGFQ